MKPAKATGARGNSTALVAAPDTVAKALLADYKLGAGSLLIRGYEPLDDAEQCGAELIPLVGKLVAETDARSPGALITSRPLLLWIAFRTETRNNLAKERLMAAH